VKAGVDVGGTFTDVALWDGARLGTAKVPTASDQSTSVVEALAVVGAHQATLLHGTTVATNAVLERRGARTALVTDAGFEDLLEIGRQDRPSLYDVEAERARPLVERGWRIGMKGRAEPGSDGRRSGDVDEVVGRVAGLEPEAVAVSMLYSYAHPQRERDVAAALRAALGDVAVSVSSDVAPEFREFERMSTTVLNAYLLPVVAAYLERLAAAVGGDVLAADTAVMRSSGGLLSLSAAAALPASVILSGPAGGVVAAGALGASSGRRSVVSFDMGGTSTDVCRIEEGRAEIAYERAIDGLPCRMPSVAIHTVGAGGGSVAWVDAGGALRVGPHSAGARPGPASYGRGGTEATVTDANLVLGRIDASTRLGASVVLDVEAAIDSLSVLAGRSGLTVDEAAIGVIDVVEAHMERAIRRVSVEEGSDPRDSVLVAFGGAGGLHATALARRLDMSGAVIPAHAGVFSALGLLLAPPRADAGVSAAVTPDTLDRLAAEVVARAEAGLPASPDDLRTQRVIVDARYVGQSHETPVEYEPGSGWQAMAERFHAAHLSRNGFARRDDPIEVVTVRAEVTGAAAVRWDDLTPADPVGEPARGSRSVLGRDGRFDASVWWRPALRPGDEIVGPAVVEEPEATTFIGAGERAVVADSGALEVSW
jgi:N-methylhydantoinase A